MQTRKVDRIKEAQPSPLQQAIEKSGALLNEPRRTAVKPETDIDMFFTRQNMSYELKLAEDGRGHFHVWREKELVINIELPSRG